MKYLGETVDIHTGGIEHIPTNHENEIAQSEAATEKPFVKYWFHNNHLMIDGKKMSKSLNNFVTVQDLQKKGIDPMALRLLFLQSHYRQQLNFTEDSINGAQEAYNRIKQFIIMFRNSKGRTYLSEEKLGKIEMYKQKFENAIFDDLQIPEALALMWEVIKSSIPSTDKLDLLFTFDEVFGLKLNEIVKEVIPEEITLLAQQRQEARKNKDFAKSDELRKKISEKGFIVEDTDKGFVIKKL
jgi:cysteinyl-tRNA synthetase